MGRVQLSPDTKDTKPTTSLTTSSTPHPIQIFASMRFLMYVVSAIVMMFALMLQTNANDMMADSSLGCADGSRCWCFLQNRRSLVSEGLARHFAVRGAAPATGPCITCPDASKCCCAAPEKGN